MSDRTEQLIEIREKLKQMKLDVIEAIANEPVMGHQIRRKIAVFLIWAARKVNSVSTAIKRRGVNL